VYHKLRDLPVDWKPEILYKDSDAVFAPIPYHPNMELQGALTWPQYFSHRRKEVVDLFKNKKIIDKISGKFKNSVSMHVRRGDYIVNKDSLLLTAEYYKRALAHIESKAQVDVIYVFTEDRIKRTYDLRWCQANLKDRRIVYESANIDYLDMYKMSLCTHNIIANSSFSWWGSYLNENEDKIVCAPVEWFLPYKSDTPKPFMCYNWTLIAN
jgi:hypothetical protein